MFYTALSQVFVFAKEVLQNACVSYCLEILSGSFISSQEFKDVTFACQDLYHYKYIHIQESQHFLFGKHHFKEDNTLVLHSLGWQMNTV